MARIQHVQQLAAWLAVVDDLHLRAPVGEESDGNLGAMFLGSD